MIEKTILLKDVNPIDFYGVNNRHFDLLTSFFPKVKVVARGAEVYVTGPAEEIRLFEEKMEKGIKLMVSLAKKYNVSYDQCNEIKENFKVIFRLK